MFELITQLNQWSDYGNTDYIGLSHVWDGDVVGWMQDTSVKRWIDAILTYICVVLHIYDISLIVHCSSI